MEKNCKNGRKLLSRSAFVSFQIAGSDPVYIVLRSSEEKDKWLYFLKNAAGDAAMSGTPFEVLVQRMMSEPRSSG